MLQLPGYREPGVHPSGTPRIIPLDPTTGLDAAGRQTIEVLDQEDPDLVVATAYIGPECTIAGWNISDRVEVI